MQEELLLYFLFLFKTNNIKFNKEVLTFFIYNHSLFVLTTFSLTLFLKSTLERHGVNGAVIFNDH